MQEPNVNDEAALRMLAGASFGPDAKVVLPSGREIGGDEAQVLSSFHAPAAGAPLGHFPIDSADFRAGMAFAAHSLRHLVNLAHGHSGYIPVPDMKPCCKREIIDFAEGAAAGFDETAGPVAEHEH